MSIRNPTPIATTATPGKVKPDGTSITVAGDGTIVAAGAPPTGAAGGDLSSASNYPFPLFDLTKAHTWTAPQNIQNPASNSNTGTEHAVTVTPALVLANATGGVDLAFSGTGATTWMGMQFTPGGNTTVGSVLVALKADSGFVSNNGPFLAIYSDSGGLPGTRLASSQDLTYNQIFGNRMGTAYTSWIFNVQTILVGGTPYWLVLYPNNPFTVGKNVVINSKAGGLAATYNGSVWSASTGTWVFQINAGDYTAISATTTAATALQAASQGGYAIFASSQVNQAIRAQSTELDAIRGDALGAGIGVQGTSVSGNGLEGDSTNGNAVAGNATNGIGVYGHSVGSQGVSGASDNDIGVRAAGGLAPIRMAAAGSSGAPSSGAHTAGEFYVDSAGTLYYCTVAGTPGTWHQLDPRNTQGVAGSIPTAATANAGQFYYATDTQTLYLSTGSAWVAVAAPGGVPGPHGSSHEPGGTDDVYIGLGHEAATRVETIPRLNVNASNSLTSGNPILSYVTPRTGLTVTNFYAATSSTAGSSLTLVRLGIYTVDGSGNLALVAQSADVHASGANIVGGSSNVGAFLSGSQVYQIPITLDGGGGAIANYTLVRGQRYVFALLVTGSTMPGIRGIATTPGIYDRTPKMAAQVTGKTDLTTPITSGSLGISGAMLWIATE